MSFSVKQMRFEPFKENQPRPTDWIVEDTHLVAYEPKFADLTEVLGTDRVSEFTRTQVRVAAFDLSSLVNESVYSPYPNMWNWSKNALSFLNELASCGFIAVIFENRGSMYVGEESCYWEASEFKNFYSLRNKVIRSYRKNVNESGLFIYAAPKRPANKKGRVLSPQDVHREYQKPGIGMWNAFEHGLKNRLGLSVTIDYARSFFVGDSEVDELFAEAAGLNFFDSFPEIENGEPILPELSDGDSSSENES